MGATTDVIVFVAGGADAVNSLTQGSAGGGPAGAAGQIIGTAGSAAQPIGTIVGATQIAGVVGNSMGAAGGVLTAVQITIDLNDGQSIKAGDALAVGFGIPVAIAAATGILAAGSVLIPIASLVALSAALMNLRGLTLDDIFKLLDKMTGSSDEPTYDRDSVEKAVRQALPITGDVDVLSSVIVSNPDPLVKDIKYVMVDPLVLDLDGDGLEITPLSRGVQFDGNGDTIRTNTSWVQADDGLLALDRNGNGVIDSGRELFGDETLLADGTKAAHGFAALAELDVGGAANATGGAGDGVFDAKDAQYTNVRIWRDLNQDGISQAGEMQTLQEAGIASVKLSSTKTETNYGDAQLVQSGSFTRADGSEGQAGSFILAQNNAVTTHAPIAISAEAAALMAMGTASAALPANQGSGWVRYLQEAATLTPQLLECCRQRPGRHLCRSVTSRHWCQSSPSTVSRADG